MCFDLHKVQTIEPHRIDQVTMIAHPYMPMKLTMPFDMAVLEVDASIPHGHNIDLAHRMQVANAAHIHRTVTYDS
jgi:hypothetical protein